MNRGLRESGDIAEEDEMAHLHIASQRGAAGAVPGTPSTARGDGRAKGSGPLAIPAPVAPEERPERAGQWRSTGSRHR